MLMRAPFSHVALGDLITLPDGTSISVRSRVSLTTPVRQLSGFLIGGECQVVITVPALAHDPLGVLLPGRIPHGAGVHSLVEGATSYWAPHLPAVRGAMGELLWRVAHVDGVAEPVVILYRGEERIPYLHRGVLWPKDLTFTGLPRTSENDIDVPRHSGEVITALPTDQLWEKVVQRQPSVHR